MEAAVPDPGAVLCLPNALRRLGDVAVREANASARFWNRSHRLATQPSEERVSPIGDRRRQAEPAVSRSSIVNGSGWPPQYLSRAARNSALSVVASVNSVIEERNFSASSEPKMSTRDLPGTPRTCKRLGITSAPYRPRKASPSAELRPARVCRLRLRVRQPASVCWKALAAHLAQYLGVSHAVSSEPSVRAATSIDTGSIGCTGQSLRSIATVSGNPRRRPGACASVADDHPTARERTLPLLAPSERARPGGAQRARKRPRVAVNSSFYFAQAASWSATVPGFCVSAV